MSWWRRLRDRDRLERELDAELRYHVDRRVDDYILDGLPEDEARRLARLEFGGDDQIKERCRDARGTRWLEDTWHDLRFAARLLARERWYSLASIAALALGIAVTTMIVTIVNGYNLRGLQVGGAGRVMFAGTRDRSGNDHGVAVPDYLAWRSARSFASLGAFATAQFTIADTDASPDEVSGAYVTDDVFAIVGTTPLLGRGFLPDDNRADAAPVAVLGYRLWASRYDASPDVVGRTGEIGGTPTIVVGVMREGFEFPFRQALWMPLARLPGIESARRNQPELGVVGRLAAGIDASQARDELAALSTGIALGAAPGNDVRPEVVPFGLQQVGRLGDQQPPLLALATAVFVLLIACANVAGVLLARTAARGREVAIRSSLGATRWRIVRQLLVESLLLSLAAAAGGLWLSRLGVEFVATAFGRNVPYWMHFPIDLRVTGALLASCVGCALVFGLGPALLLSRTDASGTLKEHGRSGVTVRVRLWTQSLLTAETAVTIVLLAGGALMLRSFLAVYRVDRIVDASRVLTMEIALPEERYRTAGERTAFYEALRARLDADGGAGLSLVSTRPFVGGPTQDVLLDGQSNGERPVSTAVVIYVDAAYFDTLGVPLSRGRAFGADAAASVGQPAIVNQRFADVFFPQQDPLGRTIRVRESDADAAGVVPLTIVGVAPTIRQRIAGGARPVVYRPLREHHGARAAILARHAAGVTGIAPSVRRIVASLDRDVTVFNVRPLADLLDDSRLQPRLIGTIVAAFAGIALVLSVVGLYGFTAYATEQRTHEIGVRMALGARPAQVVGLFMRRAMRPLSAGLVAGLAGALAAGRLLRGVLIDTSSTDPAVLVSISLLLVSASCLACFLAARKAAYLDPLATLRHD